MIQLNSNLLTVDKFRLYRTYDAELMVGNWQLLTGGKNQLAT